MAVSRVGYESASNTSAKTSLTVTVPSGTQPGDLMVAVIGIIGQVTITPPAGWTLLGTQDDGSFVRSQAYWRTASVEPASYKWSFPAFKAYALIAVYRGVDSADPIDANSGVSTSGTSHTSPSITAVTGDWLLTSVVARHTATGSATTWSTGTGTDLELLDTGSNSGSGVDFSGAVYDSNTTVAAGSVSRTLTSSQTESSLALWSILIHAAAESGGGFDTGSSVTNGTAGTSVTLTKPAGTSDDDLLVAVISEAGTATITPPAGWTLAADAEAGANLKSAVYWKIAASEGASWTWTLGSSLRNTGWVANYTGADTSDPLTVRSAVLQAGTEYTTPTAEVLDPARWLGIVSAVRTASGAATTWTGPGTERAELSTNAGSGLDITTAVYEATSLAARFDATVTANQAQSYAVLWSVGIEEPFTAPAFPLDPNIEVAFGADPDGDPATWTWTDVTTSVLYELRARWEWGRPDAFSTSGPSGLEFTLLNTSGDFTPEHPSSTYWPSVVRNTPVRVTLGTLGVNPPYHQVTCFVDSWTPAWDTSENLPVVNVKASGRLRRLIQGERPSKSAMYRSMTRVTPRAYWPCEDGSQAGQLANALPGPALGIAGDVTLAANDTLAGSQAVPTLETGAKISGNIAAYTDTGQWAVVFALKLPSSPTSTTTLATVTTNGALRTWQIRMVAGSPDDLQVRVLNSSGSQVFTDSVSVVDDADFTGEWALIALAATTNGSDVDYVLSFYSETTGSGTASGTRTSTTHGSVRGINVTAASATTGMSVGHIGIFTDLGFDPSADPGTISGALNGHAGETPAVRFARLCTEEGIPYEVIDATDSAMDITMGPQGTDTITGLLRDAEAVDGGMIHDAGVDGDIVFVTRASRYNAFHTMTLDWDAGQVAEFTATYDDQQIRNDVTVSRPGGSSARFVDDDHVAAQGRYVDDVGLRINGDVHLPEVAGWRVNLGTVAGMRFPRISWDLRRNPTLARDHLACRGGSRIAVTNLPSTAPPGDVDVFIEGMTIVLTDHSWDVVANCSPAAPFDVGVLEAADGSALILDTDGAELTSSLASSGASTFDVTSTGNDLWTTDSMDFPLDVDVGGERITISAISGSTSPQTFTVDTRSVNGIVKAHAAGTRVRVWSPNVLAL